MYKKINYEELNAKQKENYNFQKIAAHLADYGFNCLRLSDDWQGADFIACHINGSHFLKIQLKGRLIVNKKYEGKEIYIAFRASGIWYLYPHDKVRDEILNFGLMANTSSWEVKGGYGWPRLSVQLKSHMQQYAID